MFSCPKIIVPPASPIVKLGGKPPPVPRKDCSPRMACLPDLRQKRFVLGLLPVRFHTFELPAGLCLDLCDQSIDLGERQISQSFQDQVCLVDGDGQVQFSHLDLSAFAIPADA